MTEAQFRNLKESLRNRTAGAFVDGFYYMQDMGRQSEQGFYRPQLRMVCVFQRPEEGASWTRPYSQGSYTNQQNLHLATRNPQAPRVPVSELPPQEHHLGWTPLQVRQWLEMIATAPLEFLLLLVYGKLVPMLQTRNSLWAKKIIQPQNWRTQWLFHEVLQGQLSEQPRLASRMYSYYRHGFPLLQQRVVDHSDDPTARDPTTWFRTPSQQETSLRWLRMVLLSDPQYTAEHHGEHPVDVDLLSTPYNWNLMGREVGSDFDFPNSVEVRDMNPVAFENGLTLCISSWFVSSNYRTVVDYISEGYWNQDFDPDMPDEQIVLDAEFWLQGLQEEWNMSFLPDSLWRGARMRNADVFAGVNIDLPAYISRKCAACYSLRQSMAPLGPLTAMQHIRRIRAPSLRLMGRGATVAFPPLQPEERLHLHDFVFFHLLPQHW